MDAWTERIILCAAACGMLMLLAHVSGVNRASLEQRARGWGAVAMNEIGAMYYSRSVAQDEAQAAHWYRKAAEAGHANARRILDLMRVR